MTVRTLYLKKPFQIIVSSTLKKHINFMAGRVSLPIPQHLMFLKEKVTLLFVISFPCFVLNGVYT